MWYFITFSSVIIRGWVVYNVLKRPGSFEQSEYSSSSFSLFSYLSFLSAIIHASITVISSFSPHSNKYGLLLHILILAGIFISTHTSPLSFSRTCYTKPFLLLNSSFQRTRQTHLTPSLHVLIWTCLGTYTVKDSLFYNILLSSWFSFLLGLAYYIGLGNYMWG